MWTKILLVLAATVLITGAVLLFAWGMAHPWHDVAHLLKRLRHRARHPWEDEERALADLQEAVRTLDPSLTGREPDSEADSRSQ